MTDTTLTLERHIHATPDRVWRCWTEPDLARQWFAPRPVETTAFEIDPRPGGAFRTVMVVPDHGEMVGDPGCILLAEKDRRLAWTNALGPEFVPNRIGTGPTDFAFSVDIRLTPEDGGTRYVATVRHATPEDTRKHADMGFHDGWGRATDQLGALAATL